MMKIRVLFRGVLLAIGGLIFTLVPVSAEPGLAMSRDANSEWPPRTKVVLRQLEQIAGSEPWIQVWIDFDISFQGNPALRTQEVIEREQRELKQAIVEVIHPIVDKGFARIVQWGPPIAAPGCLIEVRKQAFKELMRSDRVMHVGYLPYDASD